MSQMREIDYGNSVGQRTLCVLVVDSSGSMDEPVAGTGRTRIQMLNEGIGKLHSELLNDETARNRVRLAVVIVGGPRDDADIMMDWTDAADFQPISFSAGGRTPLGKGMRIALQMIEQEKQNLKAAGIQYTRPWVMVMSDGAPTDEPSEWQMATAECRDAEKNKRCVIYPIGVDDGDLNVLGQLSSMTPPVKMSGAKFREFFVWLSSSLGAMSRSAPGQQAQLTSISPWASVSG